MKIDYSEQENGSRIIEYNSELWHAPVGAYLVQKEARNY